MKAYQQETQLRTAGGSPSRTSPTRFGGRRRERDQGRHLLRLLAAHHLLGPRERVRDRFLEDFALLLKRLVPSDNYYAHDDWDRRTENICPEDMDFGNGHSHCMSMLLGPAGESIPVRDSELCLGTWQRVLFLELDRERDRRWLVQVVGV